MYNISKEKCRYFCISNTPSHFDPNIVEHKWSLTYLVIPFVHISAKSSTEDTYIMDLFPCSICSRVKWDATSICFDRLLRLGLYATSIAALLLQKNAFGISFFNNFWTPHCNLKWCYVIIPRAIYSASQVEVTTDRCFRHLQELVAFPHQKIYPEKLLLVSRQLP